MKSARRLLRAFVCALFVAAWIGCLTPTLAIAQASTGAASQAAPGPGAATPAAQSAHEPASAPAANENAQQAYTLPPDQLARAIALSRIRDILNIAGSIWGIVFLWLLLVLHGWAGLKGGRRRSRANDGFRG